MEQREGRVDRYGQSVPVVKSYLLYGQDNPVDGAVLDVLIRKAVRIHKTLGITVPVPMDSASVTQAVFKSLFDRATDTQQLSLFDLLNSEESNLNEVYQSWDRAVEREKLSRTRFAQKSIKPEEVQQELLESDRILGNGQDVERFVLSAGNRLNCSLIKKKQGWLLPSPPQFLKAVLGDKSRLISFTTPAPEGVEYIGRNHPLVEGLARHLLEEALSNVSNPTAARCGFTVTDAVDKRTTLLLLRLRHLLDASHQSLLAEECLVAGFTGSPANPIWLESETAIPSVSSANALLQQAQPIGDVAIAMKRLEVAELIGRIGELEDELRQIAERRSHTLSQSHRRVRAMTKEGQVRVKPQLPMDILGILILQPGQPKVNR